jgi:hypothetical protein
LIRRRTTWLLATGTGFLILWYFAFGRSEVEVIVPSARGFDAYSSKAWGFSQLLGVGLVLLLFGSGLFISDVAHGKQKRTP